MFVLFGVLAYILGAVAAGAVLLVALKRHTNMTWNELRQLSWLIGKAGNLRGVTISVWKKGVEIDSVYLGEH